MTGPDPLDYGWWLASRAAGVTAYLLASIAVICGLMMAGRVAKVPARKQALRQIHEHAALAGLVAICVHGITLVGDRYMHPGFTGILVPFTISYRPLAVASGIVAAYMAAGLGLSFYVKKRVGAARWRKLHQFTMLAWSLGLVHAIFAGTDTSTLWLRMVFLWTAVPILVLFIVRVTEPRRRAARRAGAPAREPRLRPTAAAAPVHVAAMTAEPPATAAPPRDQRDAMPALAGVRTTVFSVGELAPPRSGSVAPPASRRPVA